MLLLCSKANIAKIKCLTEFIFIKSKRHALKLIETNFFSMEQFALCKDECSAYIESLKRCFFVKLITETFKKISDTQGQTDGKCSPSTQMATLIWMNGRKCSKER